MIYSLDSAALPKGFTPLEAVAVVKCLDDEGDVVIVTRSTDALKVWDRVGLLTVSLDDARHEAAGMWTRDGEENDSDV